MAMTRREEREEAFLMLFEKELVPEKTVEEIYANYSKQAL